MTRYLLYFVTGMATATVILFFRGYVSVPHTVYSDVALRVAMVLLGVASWLTLYRVKAGALLALLCCTGMAPWLLRVNMFVWRTGSRAPEYVQLAHAILAVLVAVSLLVSLRYVLSRGAWRTGTSSPGPVVKVLLTLLPLAVVAAWFLVMNKI